MPISFRCPEGHKLNVPDELAGRKARCPKCRRKMYIPQDNADPNQWALAADGSETSEKTDISPQRSAYELSDSAAESDEVVEAVAAPDAPLAPSPAIYRVDSDKVQNVRLLSLALLVGALFTAAPVAWHVNVFTSPEWTRLVLLVSLLQLAYAAWLASFPDWVSVWVAMLVHALVATAYGAVLAIVLHTPVDTPLPLGLEIESRTVAAGWCLCVVLVTGLATFACGRVCAQWRKSDALRVQRAEEAARIR